MINTELAKRRLEVAERFEQDATGERQGGLNLTVIEQYMVVDDGQDRWMILTENYDLAVETVVDEILTGDFEIPADDDEEMQWYDRLCTTTHPDVIYSQCGGGTLRNVNDLQDEGEDADTIRELFDALGEDYDEFIADES